MLRLNRFSDYKAYFKGVAISHFFLFATTMFPLITCGFTSACLIKFKAMRITLYKVMDVRGLTITQVSKKTGIPRSTIGDILTGKSCPRMDVMEKLAKGLDVHIEDLYESPQKSSENPDKYGNVTNS